MLGMISNYEGMIRSFLIARYGEVCQCSYNIVDSKKYRYQGIVIAVN